MRLQWLANSMSTTVLFRSPGARMIIVIVVGLASVALGRFHLVRSMPGTGRLACQWGAFLVSLLVLRLLDMCAFIMVDNARETRAGLARKCSEADLNEQEGPRRAGRAGSDRE